jgi:uncharacterized protein (TIGR01777 family)
MRIAVTGASGFLGSHLLPRLREQGHEVLRLVRHQPDSADEVFWDPYDAVVDMAALQGVRAVIHLAGAGVGDRRWTSDYKQQIRDSRVLGTRTLVTALTQLDPLPDVLVAASAIGFYGARGEHRLTEDSKVGDGFLADVVREWEAETLPAAEAGIRISTARTGLVLAPDGGALAKLLPLIRAGVAGPLGSGQQWWSWITLHDELSAITFLLDHELPGPVNLVGPQPARQGDVIRALARRLGRPALLPTPAFALRLALGEFAGDVLSSQRVFPQRLLDAGFRHDHPDLDSASDWIAGTR